MAHQYFACRLILPFLAILSRFLSIHAATTLQPADLYEGIQQGLFDLVVDVRTQEEWDVGHLENSTFAMNLAQSEVPLPSELLACKDIGCPIVLFCRSGNRAGVAIERMVNEYGFDTNNLFNGLGVSQWTEAGYPLVTTPESTEPMCEQRNEFCELLDENEEELEETVSPTTLAPTTTTGTPLPVLTISADELYKGMMNDQFHMVIDVRSIAEFEAGHIPNVTFIEGLAADGVEPTLLLDNNATCLYTACHIAVTCQTGGRAGVAITRLQNEFNFVYAQFYNGGGVSQWVSAGYDLVADSESVVPKCATGNGGMRMMQRNNGDGACDACCMGMGDVDDDMMLPLNNETDDTIAGTSSGTNADSVNDMEASGVLPFGTSFSMLTVAAMLVAGYQW